MMEAEEPSSSEGTAAGAEKKPKSAKKFIKSAVTVHDRTQIETVFDYFLFRGGGAPAADPPPNGSLRYKVEAFLFYPRQFGLDQNTYPKERFFQDMRPLLRFREPKLGYKVMMGEKPGSTSPLTCLRDAVETLARGGDVGPMQNVLDEVRLFACGFVSTVLRGIDRGRRRLDKLRQAGLGGAAGAEGVERAKTFDRLSRLLEKADQILAEYRRVLGAAAVLPVEQGGELVGEMRLIDEYCHYRLRDAVAYLLLMTKDFRDEGGEAACALHAKVVEALSRHDRHAEENGYLRISVDSSERQRERFIHRRGELKRHIWEVLFLQIRTQPLFALQRQIGAMVAAGFAALFYAVAQLLLLIEALQPKAMRDLIGMTGLLFVGATAVAYIVKDRMKEIGRSYFGGGIFRKIPDHSERIYYNNRRGEKRTVGSIRESAKYLAPDALPPPLQALRHAHAYGQSVADEAIDNVLHYTKIIEISSTLRILGRYPLRAVHDILRLNIDACLPRLGEPERVLNVVDAAGGVQEVTFPKVYYLDMALSYSRAENQGPEQEQALDYFRLVIDKNGLLRIERLA